MSNIDLNSKKSIATLDKSNLLGSIEALDKQIEHAWAETRKIAFTPKAKIENVIVAGMGGSALGADVIRTVFKTKLKVPFEIIRDYTLPGFVGPNTLVILSSYSGSTEETLSVAEEALKNQAQAMVIAAGGKLIELAKQHQWSYYQIDPIYNPSNQPRMAIGYSIFGTLGLLEKAGVIGLDEQIVSDVCQTVKQQVASCGIEVEAKNNQAKLLSYAMFSKQTTLIAPDFLAGGAHVATNQSNENSKTFTNYHVLPELNHHLLEALSFPEDLRSNHLFILIESALAHVSNQKRVSLTQQIIDGQGIETIKVSLEASDKLAQTFELISLFSFVSLYQSMLQKIDPSPIPIVEKFKQALKNN